MFETITRQIRMIVFKIPFKKYRMRYSDAKLRSCRCPLRKQKWLAKKSITKTIACFTYPNMSCRYYRCLNALCEKKIIETPWCDFTSSWEEREKFKKPSLFSFALLLLISSLCAIFVNTSRVMFTKEAIFWTNSSN